MKMGNTEQLIAALKEDFQIEPAENISFEEVKERIRRKRSKGAES